MDFNASHQNFLYAEVQYTTLDTEIISWKISEHQYVKQEIFINLKKLIFHL